MSGTFSKFFNLRTNPFGETPDTGFFYPARAHRAALEGLTAAIRAGKGFSVLLGEVGAGKTLVTRVLLRELARLAPTVDTALILYPHCRPAELLRAIGEELELPAPADFGPLDFEGHKRELDRLNARLLESAGRGRTTLLVIDEAQNLPLDTLETIRLLSNLETEHAKLIQIVLVAQPEFEARLARPELRQLRQRIGLWARLTPFAAFETEAYIKHRLERAGGANLLRFAPGAFKIIHQRARGIPREINLICDQLLAASQREGHRLLEAGWVRRAIGFSSQDAAPWYAGILRRAAPKAEGPR